MKSDVIRDENYLKSLNKSASRTLSLSTHGPAMSEGVTALLWMMRSPKGLIGTVKNKYREVMK